MFDGLTKPSTVGKWTVIVPPLNRRALDLHIMWRESPASAIHDPETGKTRSIETFEVSKFKMVVCPDYDFSPEGPALSCSGFLGFNEGNDVIDFMQAIVNEAAKLGIYPQGMSDMTKELTAVKDHLHDMRLLAFNGVSMPTIPTRK